MSEQDTFHHPNTPHQSSEPFGTGRNDSEPFGIVPNRSEEVGTIPNLSEELDRVEKYSLTVRDVAHMFEEAGVPRTERSILKWCAPTPHGMPRLTCQYEPNERRWFITEESVRRAVAEEIAKQRELDARSAQAHEPPSADQGNVNRTHEDEREDRTDERAAFEERSTAAEKEKMIRELEYKLRDEQIASRAKDVALNRMEKERADMFDQVVKWSHRVGVLETKLLQLEAPKQTREEEKTFTNMYPAGDVPNGSEQQKEAAGHESESEWQGERYP